MSRSRLLLLLATCSLALLLVGASTASARGPRIVAPKRGSVLPLGSEPTFKVRDGSRNARKYHIFMTVSTSKKRSRRTGDLKQTSVGTFTSMKRSGVTHTYTTPDYSFPTWFMMRPGKYYWQAFRIDCRVRGCHIHSKVSSFFVR